MEDKDIKNKYKLLDVLNFIKKGILWIIILVIV